jgi:hypothetical protein
MNQREIIPPAKYILDSFEPTSRIAVLAINRDFRDFFDQCPHRMACARCGFYRPKNSAAALFFEGKNNLLRLQQDIPLTEAEANAVEDGVNAFEKLLAQLRDVPTPAGPTPRKLQSGLVQIEPTKERRE